MVIRKTLISLAAASLVFGSTAAVAQPVVTSRSATHVARKSDLAHMSSAGWLIALVIVGGVIAIIATDHHHHNPVSP